MPPITTTEAMNCICGNTLGREYRIDGVLIGALCGGIMVTEGAHGVCPNCGRGVHITVNRKALVKLMAHFGQTQELSVEISDEKVL